MTTITNRARLDPTAGEFESILHPHDRRLTKYELVRHLMRPHKTASGWSSMAGPESDLRKWHRYELERQHAEFHGEV